MAGCLGDDENGDEENGDDENGDDGKSLAITNVAFADGQPSGYREFEETSSTTFEQTDVVWIYFEPNGFERESAGDGEVEVDIDMGFSITGPNGEELAADTDTLTRAAPEGEDIDAYFSGNFQPPIPATGGEYTATLTVTDRIADAGVEETTTFTVEAGEELAVENVTFLADQPRGYRDFDTAPNDTFGVTDPIRVYFEPTGFSTEEADNSNAGDVSVDLITSVTITDASGTEVYDNDDILRQSFPEEDRDEYFAFWNVSLPSGADPGQYTVTITVEDQVSGQTAETTATFIAEPVAELTIENVTFLDGPARGYRDFDTAPGQSYPVTDPIRIYFEPNGFGTEEATGGELRFDMTTSLVITDNTGTEVYNNTDSLRRTLSEDQIDQYFGVWGASLPPEVESGQYTAEIALEDQFTGQTTDTTATFTLEDAEYSRSAQQFLDAIRTELEITVTGFAERDVVNLRYNSPFEIQTENARSQISYIAGAYAGAVDQGWSSERLVGTVNDGNNGRYRFEVDSRSAQAFINEQITAEEFAGEVLNSLEEL
jgi:hypothetical protein